MRTSAKILLGVYAAAAGVWLAGSAYFLAHGEDEDLFVAGLQEESLAPEENSYPHFKVLQSLVLSNCYNYTDCSGFLKAETNDQKVTSRMMEMVSVHSNLFACVQKIVGCRGFRKDDDGRPLSLFIREYTSVRYHYLVRAACEGLNGDVEAAWTTLDELIAFDRVFRQTGCVDRMIVGDSEIASALAAASSGSFAVFADRKWRDRVSRAALACEQESLPMARSSTDREIARLKGRVSAVMKDGRGFNAPLRLLNEDGGCRHTVEAILGFSKFKRPLDWRQVICRGLGRLLDLFPGYSRYAFKPNATVNRIGTICDEEFALLENGVYDKSYCDKIASGLPRWYDVLKPNCRGEYCAAQCRLGLLFYPLYHKSVYNLRSVRVVLACRNFREDKGRYPTDLVELVPEYLESVPIDSFTGEPIRYNAEHGYLWTPGEGGAFDGEIKFDGDGYVSLRNRKQLKWVRFLDHSKVNRPPQSSKCADGRSKE